MALPPQLGALIEADEHIGDPTRLRELALEQGYLLCRQLVPRRAVEDIQSAILDVANRHGLLADRGADGVPRSKPGVAIFERDTSAWMAFYREILSLHELNVRIADPRIYRIVETVVQTPVFHHPRVNVRFFANLPFQFASPPHRDFTWIGGTPDVWTCWTPLMRIDWRLGGLQLLPGSHCRDYDFRGADETEGLCVPASDIWHTAECFEPGDVLLFNSRTVHGGGGNFLQDRIRISAECRLQPIREPVRTDVLEPHWSHKTNQTWDEVYGTWPEDEPSKYYWRQLPLTLVDSTAHAHHQDLRKRYVWNLMRLKKEGR